MAFLKVVQSAGFYALSVQVLDTKAVNSWSSLVHVGVVTGKLAPSVLLVGRVVPSLNRQRIKSAHQCHKTPVGQVPEPTRMKNK